MEKTVIAPIIAVLVLLARAFGLEIGEDLISQVVTWVITAYALYKAIRGIIQNHQKPKA